MIEKRGRSSESVVSMLTITNAVVVRNIIGCSVLQDEDQYLVIPMSKIHFHGH